MVQAVVSGKVVRRVVFTIAGKVIAHPNTPMKVKVKNRKRPRTLKARVTFADGTPAVTLRVQIASRTAPTSPSRRSSARFGLAG